MNAGGRRATWWARQVLLTAGAVVGVACLLLTIGAMLFGLRPLVFQSGSMSPTIRTGDLAISHSVGASSLEEGQVVSVPLGDGTRVTHRIVSIDHRGSKAVLLLRGDANKAADPTPYQVAHADVVVFHVPRLGYLVGWLSSPFGLFLLGLYAAFLVSVLVRRSPAAGPGGPGGAVARLSPEPQVVPPSPPRRRWTVGPRLRRQAVVATVAVAAGAAAAVGAEQQVTPTLAAFTDAVPVTGVKLTAASTFVTTPSGLRCTGNGNPANTVTLTWAAVSGASKYTVHYGPSGAATRDVLPPATTWTSDRNEDGVAWVTATVGASTSADTAHLGYRHGDCLA